jgi:hypothetical protein
VSHKAGRVHYEQSWGAGISENLVTRLEKFNIETRLMILSKHFVIIEQTISNSHNFVVGWSRHEISYPLPVDQGDWGADLANLHMINLVTAPSPTCTWSGHSIRRHRTVHLVTVGCLRH